MEEDKKEMTDLEKLSMSLFMNKKTYNKYINKNDEETIKRNEEMEKYREEIIDLTNKKLRDMDYQITTEIDDIFNSYIKALIRHFELKEVEETNKYNIEENKEVQVKSPMGTDSYFSGGNSYWGNRIRKVSSEDIMNK
tara:strand:+ start:350 stop:763 length:414 start_codon:yes stop_codon:yes gene_type:complete